MYKNNRFIPSGINNKTIFDRKVKRKPGKKTDPKLKRTLCFITGCIHILIFVLIYVFGIKDLYIGNDIEEAVADMFFGVGFLIAGIFCFRHFKLQDKDKINIVTVNIGVLIAAFFVAVLVVIWMDEWVNNLGEVREDIDGSEICIIGIAVGVSLALEGLKGRRPKEALDSVEKRDSANNEKNMQQENPVDTFENDIDMKVLYGTDDKAADEEDNIYQKDKDGVTDEKDKSSGVREVIYNTLVNNKPNNDNFY